MRKLSKQHKKTSRKIALISKNLVKMIFFSGCNLAIQTSSMTGELELESPIVVVAPAKQKVKFNPSSPLKKTLMWGRGLSVGSHFENAINLGIYPS